MKPTDFLAITYGPSGCGKTLAAVRAFPNALFLAPKGATKCSAYLEIDVDTRTPKDVSEIISALQRETSRYPAIIIDDFSILADQELQRCKSKFKGWSAFDQFNKRVYELRDAAREASCPVIFTMHQQPPKEVTNDQGTRQIPGAPLIPGWQLPEKLPAMTDFVARVVHNPNASISTWPYVYQTGPDPVYIQKDRLGISPPQFPLNLRVLLLAAGYDLPRPAKFKWMEKLVTSLSPKLQPILQEQNKEELQTLLKKVFNQLSSKYSQKHIRWALMDAIDSSNLSIFQSTLVDNFITNIHLGDNQNGMVI